MYARNDAVYDVLFGGGGIEAKDGKKGLNRSVGESGKNRAGSGNDTYLDL